MADLLLHSMAHYSDLTIKLLEHVRPAVLVEVGAEYAGSTKILADYAKRTRGVLHVIDPSPYVDVEKELSGYSGYYCYHNKISLEALDGLVGDIFFLDGDHNYWTVYNELDLIYKNNPNAFVVLHDVGFPWARRDLYYSPENIPRDFLHEHTYSHGVGLDGEIIKGGGFRGAGRFAFSKTEGGERNGVLTAIEDFVSERKTLYYSSIPPIFGLGIVCNEAHKGFVDEFFSPYRIKLIEGMERNRIELYLKVISLQDEMERIKFWSVYGLVKAVKKLISF